MNKIVETKIAKNNRFFLLIPLKKKATEVIRGENFANDIKDIKINLIVFDFK